MRKALNIKKPLIREIPDEFTGLQNKRLKVLQRGDRSYLLQNLDSQKYPYRVMEKLVLSDAWGFQELLSDYQRYQPHTNYEEALEHFQQYEKGMSPLLKAIYPYS